MLYQAVRLSFGRRLRLIAGAMLCWAHAAHAVDAATPSETVAEQLRDEAMAGHSLAYSWVSELTTRFGPRPAGSVSERAAAEWAAARLRALGFENVQMESFPITAWVRGTESAEITAPGHQPLVVAALGESPPTPPGGLDGEVVLFATLAELKASPAGSLAGKIAVVNERMVRTQSGAGYGAAVGIRFDGPEAAAQRGAIAFVLRSVGTDGHRIAHTGTTRYVGGRVPVPAFALSGPDSDQIERLVRLGKPVRLHLFSSAGYVPNARSQNILADVRGQERPNEVVLLGAHLDSWDQGTGAVDDGAGTAIIVAASKLIRDLPHRPRRTVRIVLFGSEEVGQSQPPGSAFGGHFYASAHKAALVDHLLAGESDTGADKIYFLSLPEPIRNSTFGKLVLRTLAPIGVLSVTDTPDVGTDVQPCITEGVPGFQLGQDATRYFDVHHTVDDTLDKIEPAQLDQNVAAWAALAWLAADSTVDFRDQRSQLERSDSRR